jgi:hypothetical protein
MPSLPGSDTFTGDKERNTKMKKVLLSLLVIILALGLLGAAGYAGYRYGFTQGMMLASNSNGNTPSVRPGFWMSPRGMPMHNFGNARGFDRDGFGMMRRGGFGFGFFPLFGLLARLLFWGLIVALIVWLVSRSGWRLTRTAPVVATPAAPAPVVVETPPPASTTPDDENPKL